MPAVDVDRMPPAQAAAWRRLWRILLAPDGNEETRVDASLEARTDTGETVRTEVPTNGNDSTERGIRYE